MLNKTGKIKITNFEKIEKEYFSMREQFLKKLDFLAYTAKDLYCQNIHNELHYVFSLASFYYEDKKFIRIEKDKISFVDINLSRPKSEIIFLENNSNNRLKVFDGIQKNNRDHLYIKIDNNGFEFSNKINEFNSVLFSFINLKVYSRNHKDEVFILGIDDEGNAFQIENVFNIKLENVSGLLHGISFHYEEEVYKALMREGLRLDEDLRGKIIKDQNCIYTNYSNFSYVAEKELNYRRGYYFNELFLKEKI